MHSMAIKLGSGTAIRRPISKRVRRARLRRAVSILVVSIALLVLAPQVVHMLTTAEAGPIVTYTVAPNDTLWDIAQQHSSNTDVRKMVHAIAQLNQIAGSTVHPGQVLRIPSTGGQ